MSTLAIVLTVLGVIAAAILLIVLGAILAALGLVDYVASGKFTRDLNVPKPPKKSWFRKDGLK